MLLLSTGSGVYGVVVVWLCFSKIYDRLVAIMPFHQDWIWPVRILTVRWKVVVVAVVDDDKSIDDDDDDDGLALPVPVSLLSMRVADRMQMTSLVCQSFVKKPAQ